MYIYGTLLFLLQVGFVQSFIEDIPLAPYNVKVLCRQGLRFARSAQTATQCPSSTTACGYIEFAIKDKRGINSTGVYECVDSGIVIAANSGEEDAPVPLFAELCGAVPQCSTVDLDRLNPAFTKYLITNYGLLLENLESKTLKFCCSLFHATLQKLVTSGKDRLPSAISAPVHCESEKCGSGAIGCLSHSMYSDSQEEEEADYAYEEKRRRRRDEGTDYEGINAVQLSFDYDGSSFEMVDRNEEDTSESKYNRTAILKTTALPSLNLPIKTTKKPPPSKTKHGVKYALIDEEEEETDSSCVYRHLNDELYRYCLLVYQRKNGDRCYQHNGHTICCCFVPPDRETCDPTEIDLVIPPPPKTNKIPQIIVTPPAIPATTTLLITTTVPTTTTSTTSSTTTTTTTMSPTTVPTTRVTVTATRGPAASTVATSTKRCRIVYVKGKHGRQPKVVCEAPPTATSSAYILASSFIFYLLNFVL